MTREEAINKVRQMSLPKEMMDILEALAPELAMSEDEIIRESLIKFLTEIKEISESGRTSWAIREKDAEMCKSFLDYLEKQKEQSITANDLDEEIHRFFDECIEVHDAKIYGVDERVITVDCYEITARHFAKWGEKQKEQKPKEPDWCHHKVDLSGCSEEYMKAYYDGWNNCNQQHSQCKAKQKPEQYDIDVLKKHITKDSISELAHTVIVRNGWEIVEKEQKPVECIKFDNEFENQVSHLLASVLNSEYEYNAGFVKHAAQSLLGYAKNEIRSGELDKIERLMKALKATNAQIGELVEENYKLKEQKSAQSDAEKNMFASLNQ